MTACDGVILPLMDIGSLKNRTLKAPDKRHTWKSGRSGCVRHNERRNDGRWFGRIGRAVSRGWSVFFRREMPPEETALPPRRDRPMKNSSNRLLTSAFTLGASHRCVTRYFHPGRRLASVGSASLLVTIEGTCTGEDIIPARAIWSIFLTPSFPAALGHRK